MDTAERLLALLGLLQHRAHWPADELAERLGVTARTVRRDVVRLRGYGYPVEAFAGHGGGYQLGRGARLPPLLLDDDEVLAIAVGLGAVGGLAIAEIDQASLSALAKLEHLMPVRLRSRLEALEAAIATVGPAAGNPAATTPVIDRRTLTSIAHAVHQRTVLEFDYVDGREARSRRTVEPARLVRAGLRWYLAAFDVDRDDWRTFRLDRIGAVEVSDRRFVPRAGPDPVDLVSRAAPPSSYPHRVRVVVAATAADVRRHVPVVLGHVAAADDGSTSVLEIGTDDLAWAVTYVLGLPFEVEVVGPPAARAMLARRAGELAERHTSG
ncbi:MAG: YafY family transcriptional regulator [Acidimicrobiaceae bacterium]|nr:YafY family transcriptional regulator [Acidimicrobiaceae bacterium]